MQVAFAHAIWDAILLRLFLFVASMITRLQLYISDAVGPQEVGRDDPQIPPGQDPDPAKPREAIEAEIIRQQQVPLPNLESSSSKPSQSSSSSW